MSGDEHDGDLPSLALQLTLEIGPRHSGHGNIEDQAAGVGDAVGRQEFLG